MFRKKKHIASQMDHIHTRIKLCLGNVNLCDYIFHDKILNLKYIDDADKEMS